MLLVKKGLAQSRAEAHAAIAAGGVTADGRSVSKASQLLSARSVISFARAHPYVSRGGVKLAAALDAFCICPLDAICLDLGASTGGFTQVLLERGAKRAYAIDAGKGQLHEKIRGDARVVSLEGINARFLTAEQVPDRVDFVVADVSFVSLKLVLPCALLLAEPGAWLVALFKPQFEVGRENIGKGGIVRSEAVRKAALAQFVDWLQSVQKWTVRGTMQSPIAGGDGNTEYLVVAHNERGR